MSNSVLLGLSLERLGAAIDTIIVDDKNNRTHLVPS